MSESEIDDLLSNLVDRIRRMERRISDLETLEGGGGSGSGGLEDVSLDFTGTLYDTKAECQAAGLRFSDDDSPFGYGGLRAAVPGAYPDLAGSWSHVAGSGWQPASTTNSAGPALLLPLARPGDWEMSITIDYQPTDVAHQINLLLGCVPMAGPGLHAEIYDNSGAASQLICAEVTQSYTGSTLAGTGERTYKIRSRHAAFSVYDEQDDAWHDSESWIVLSGQYQDMSPAFVFVQAVKLAGADLSRVYLQELGLTYL